MLFSCAGALIAISSVFFLLIYILNINFDLVVIASIDENYTNDAINKLINLGISRNKISCFNLNINDIEKAILEIGFDLNTFNYKHQIYAV